jgi:hypothetical protein
MVFLIATVWKVFGLLSTIVQSCPRWPGEWVALERAGRPEVAHAA